MFSVAEIIDHFSGHPYYKNKKDGSTTWEKPVGFGEAKAAAAPGATKPERQEPGEEPKEPGEKAEVPSEEAEELGEEAEEPDEEGKEPGEEDEDPGEEAEETGEEAKEPDDKTERQKQARLWAEEEPRLRGSLSIRTGFYPTAQCFFAAFSDQPYACA